MRRSDGQNPFSREPAVLPANLLGRPRTIRTNLTMCRPDKNTTVGIRPLLGVNDRHRDNIATPTVATSSQPASVYESNSHGINVNRHVTAVMYIVRLVL